MQNTATRVKTRASRFTGGPAATRRRAARAARARDGAKRGVGVQDGPLGLDGRPPCAASVRCSMRRATSVGRPLVVAVAHPERTGRGGLALLTDRLQGLAGRLALLTGGEVGLVVPPPDPPDRTA